MGLSAFFFHFFVLISRISFAEHLVRTLELFSVSLDNSSGITKTWVNQTMLDIGIPLPAVFDVYNR